jgi:hypothetical protein
MTNDRTVCSHKRHVERRQEKNAERPDEKQDSLFWICNINQSDWMVFPVIMTNDRTVVLDRRKEQRDKERIQGNENKIDP